ncbi:hypothetical protein Ae168Ps1_0639 [Pseudonocardia sp. Ae168_Ps1]|nr:hypothetical protein Ae150APs1_0641 [Pseudonocardia sp. Ae150A_Ps1]OLL78233.1 hypothetical protein Ae168Ps1_0639 [Pseudonocardia sp. Ae168_Ps1]OLL87645.1 hypothetical protein Ae263Ps1_4700c [Pseudonocardia sp. Ae263_Ps1]OLL92328.1 hypothetical protein Ae356Ps1_2225 [Pseudonocardia sp. Ae356_Ps1]
MKEIDMPATPPLALDRYIAATDRAVADDGALDDLLDVFAPDAVVQLDDVPVRGRDALRELYRDFVTVQVEATHYWNTRVLADGREEATWACAARVADGSVVTAAGVECATVGPDGRIVSLRNEFTRRPA